VPVFKTWVLPGVESDPMWAKSKCPLLALSWHENRVEECPL